MQGKPDARTLPSAWLAVLAAAATLLLACGEKSQGQAVYEAHCASCHEIGMNALAPDPQVMAAMPASVILASLESGKMQAEGSTLSPEERRLVAEHLGAPADAAPLELCETGPPPAVIPIYWSGFSPEPANLRHQSTERAGLAPDALDELELAWAFALPDSSDVRTQPAVLGDLVVMGNTDGRLFALDRTRGCVIWEHRGLATARTPIVARASGDAATVYYGDLGGFVSALDAATGKLLWRVRVHEHPFAMLTGAPALHEGRLYVPVSSYEVVVALDPTYSCCTFRGAVVALDADDGRVLWTTSMGAEATSQGRTWPFPERFGPSGAPVWLSPAVDAERSVVYVGTGQNYSLPSDEWSDAILALDLDDGTLRWRRQFRSKDAWTIACVIPAHPNCPDEEGPDLDIGASPVLAALPDGRTLLLVGEKAGVVHALDPDREGSTVWQRRVGRGGKLGGIHWGLSVAGQRVFVPVSDREDGEEYPDPPRPGLAALDLASGDVLWQVDVAADCPEHVAGCKPGLSAPASSVGDRVLTGALDGHLRIFDARDGTLVFDRDLRAPFPDADPNVRGGSIDAAGPVAAGGLVLVPSGYPQHDQTPGNALFALRPRHAAGGAD